MKQTLKTWFVLSVVLLAGADFVHSQSTERKRLMNHATGPFGVKVAPSGHTPSESEEIGEMSFTKVLSGDMVGTSKGLMLTSSTSSTGAMAYVALETVTASLRGRSGTFILMHNATTRKGEPEADSLHIVVVPGSGTRELTGISGTFVIQKDAQGNHFYSFDYDLP